MAFGIVRAEAPMHIRSQPPRLVMNFGYEAHCGPARVGPQLFIAWSLLLGFCSALNRERQACQ